MNLLSKDATLEESIFKMETILNELDFGLIYSKEKHPLTNCFSVNLSFTGAKEYIYSNGKGICSEACKASALGEFIERLQTNNFFMEFYLPNRSYYPDEVVLEFDDDYLSEDLLSIYNPSDTLDSEDLVDFCSDYNDKIIALPFKNQRDDINYYFPMNLIYNLYASNGLATGNTPSEAKSQALSEIIERYVKIQIIKQGYALPKYEDNLIKQVPKVYEDIQKLRNSGYIVEVLDGSLGGKFPVIAISLINPNNATLFVSFGAHPIFEVAIERTMTELMQGRDLDALDTFEIPTFDMELVSSDSNIESHFIDSNGKIGFGFLNSRKNFEFSSWIYTGTCSKDEEEYLSNIIYGMNKEIYIREYNYLDFYSCQIVVPSMSEVYPMEDLTYNNKNSAKRIRDMVLGYKKFDPEEILDNLDDLEYNLDMGKYIGVIFEDSFTYGDFKAQIHLLAGEFEEAMGLFEFSTNPYARVLYELLKMKQEEQNINDYKEALYNVFTKEKVIQGQNIINGDEYLINVTFHQEYLNILKMYDTLAIKKEFHKN
jgi:ribosomal protein S12 methylthiotransferase accessory factor